MRAPAPACADGTLRDGDGQLSWHWPAKMHGKPCHHHHHHRQHNRRHGHHHHHCVGIAIGIGREPQTAGTAPDIADRTERSERTLAPFLGLPCTQNLSSRSLDSAASTARPPQGYTPKTNTAGTQPRGQPVLPNVHSGWVGGGSRGSPRAWGQVSSFAMRPARNWQTLQCLACRVPRQ